MEWWNNLWSNKSQEPPKDQLGYLPLIEVGPDKGKPIEDGSGRIVSPEFIKDLLSKGFFYNWERMWFQREWTAWSPQKQRFLWETYWYDIDDNNWIYRIVDRDELPPLGGGGTYGNSPWLIWENNLGSKS